MIKEISNFVASLDPEIKTLGMKPKEGLHILLGFQRRDVTQLYIDENSLKQYLYTKSKDQSPEDIAFLKKCSSRSQKSWCVNTNKCFDLPTKAIHSCSPYCIAIKRENLSGGEKYGNNKKSQVYDRISTYFEKASLLLDSDSEKERIKIFEYALNSEEKFNSWLVNIPEYGLVKDAEYVIFYLDVEDEKYAEANDRYLADKLFNTNDYNINFNKVVFGTSDFFNGYPTKKPFLTHQTASFDIASRISASEARNLYEFRDIMGRNILPKPLPIFIHLEEIQMKMGQNSLVESSLQLFKRDALENKRRSYADIIADLYQEHGDELGNYYLLYFDRDEIKDFDFVSKFEYQLKDSNGKFWEIWDFFSSNNQQTIKNVFQLQHAVLQPIFNNALITKTKSGDVQYKYFDDVDVKYCKSAVTYLLVMEYRKAFYDFIYKSKRQSVTFFMFTQIMRASVMEDIRLDEIKSGYHTQDRSIRDKMNIWFSLTENFNGTYKNNHIDMANKLQGHLEFILKLTKGEAHISSDDEYAFTVGQVIYYLLSKSKTADRSYKRLEPFLQQVHAKELNKAITRMFDSYKHEFFSNNFKLPFAEILSYDTKVNIRDLTPIMLSGIFAKNALFSDKEEESDGGVIESEEENQD